MKNLSSKITLCLPLALTLVLSLSLPLSADQSARLAIDSLSLEGDERILHIGCGQGETTAELAQRVPDGFVLGIDSSPSMIETAEHNYDQDLFINVGFQLGSAASLNFRGYFDIASSFSSLHTLEEKAAFLEGVYQSLRPEGRLLVSIPAAEDLRLAVEETIRSEKWQHLFADYVSPFHFVSPDEWRVLLQRAHFHIVHMRVIKQPREFETTEALARWLKMQLPEWEYAPMARRDELLDDIVANYLAIHPQSVEGELTLYPAHLQCLAMKGISS